MSEIVRTVALAICKSRTCEGASCCQWPANLGRVNCNAKSGAYDEAAQAAIAAMPSWQPIETAPKDGTKIDLLYPYPRGRTNDCMWFEDGVYGDGGWYWLTPVWRSYPGLGIGQYLVPESEWSVNSYPNDEPTHWRFPPTAPEAQP